ncbi:MAG: hypothetical protein IJZ80_08130 [Clostridia bacterium]|nr:hypothetical protein [Clostridia bacterium]
MNSKKETALKVIKGCKYSIFPFYIIGYLIFLGIVWVNSTSWVELGLFIVGLTVLFTLSLPMGLFGALLWTQYILEGYVKGTAKIVRCVISFLFSAVGILYTVGWIMYMTDGWDFAIATKYMPTIRWLFENSHAPVIAVDVLLLLVYPTILFLEARYRKQQRNTLLSD